jgi:hypothetical protein
VFAVPAVDRVRGTLQGEHVAWAVIWSGLAGLAVVGVVVTASEVQAARSEAAYFRGSARLWALVGAVVAAMSLAMAPTMMTMGGYPSSVQGVVFGFVALPAVVAVAACWHNAISLHRVRRRRHDALAMGDEVEAVVLEREHRPFSHDILSVTLEATLPGGEGSGRHDGGYRVPAREASQRLRLVETCPGDQWARLTPGRRVRVRLDPSNHDRYALVLFDGA